MPEITQNDSKKSSSILVKLFAPWVPMTAFIMKSRSVGKILASKTIKRVVDDKKVTSYVYARHMEWYKKGMRRFAITAWVLFVLSVSPLVSSYFTYKYIGSSKSERVANLKKIFSSKPLPKPIKNLAIITLCLWGTSVASGLLVSFINPVFAQTEKLKELTEQSRGKEKVKIWLPIGAFMDITGQDPKVIAQDDRIWASLNMSVDKDSYIEDPADRTKVLFISNFQLEEKYDYEEIPFSASLLK